MFVMLSLLHHGTLYTMSICLLYVAILSLLPLCYGANFNRLKAQALISVPKLDWWGQGRGGQPLDGEGVNK